MAPFDYLLVLASVVLGVAITELAVGLSRLLRAGDAVRWDWLAPLAAALVFLKIVTQWWTWHVATHLAAGLTFEMFLGILIGTVVLFLLAATALPETGPETIDLRVHFATVQRRFWLLFSLHWSVATGTSLWAQVAILHAHLDLRSPAMLVLPAGIALAFLRNRIVQGIGLVGFIGIYLTQYFGQVLR